MSGKSDQHRVQTDNRPHQAVQRKQYKSCDRCRKGRRACDAVARGVDPLRDSWNTDGEVLPKTCSACARTNSPCTFSWLRHVSEAKLPREMKQDQASRKQYREQLRNVASARFNQHAQRPEVIPNPELTFVQHDPEPPAHEPAGYELDNLSATRSESNRHSLACQSDFSPALPLTFGGFDIENIQEMTCPSARDASSFMTGYWPPVAGQSLDALDSTEQSIASTVELLRAAQGVHPWSPIGVCESAIVSPAPATLSSSPKVLYDPSSQMNYAFQPTTCQALTAFNPSLLAAFPGHDACMTLGSLDSELPESANKAMILSGLTQIYRDSMENALQCWVSAEYCPYTSGLSQVNQQTQTSLPHTSIYQRVFELNNTFSVLRSHSLTVEEKFGTSRALKTAVIAFASQWSHSLGHPGVPPPSSRNERIGESLELQEFDIILRESLWHQARRSLHRWADCDSILVAWAETIMALVQPPTSPFVNDWAHMGASSVPVTELADSGMANGKHPILDSDWRRRRGEAMSDLAGHQYEQLVRPLHRLLSWKRRIEKAVAIQRRRSPMASLEPTSVVISERDVGSFQLLFCTGVMIDTTSSVLNQRDPIISDEETNFSFEISEMECFGRVNMEVAEHDRLFNGSVPNVGISEKHNIWNVSILEDLKWTSALGDTNPSESIGRQELVLQKATPVKMLLWRKVGALCSLLKKETTASKTIETHVYESLQIIECWNSTFGRFLEDCIKQHQHLAYKIQSWYVILGAHWYLAKLHLARLIQDIDNARVGEKLKRALRQSSCLVQEIQKCSAYGIADLARVSRADSSLSKGREHFHFALRQTALLTEPWTDVLHQALDMSFRQLVSWQRSWDASDWFTSYVVTPQQTWIYTNTDLVVLRERCGDCLEALKVLDRRSDLAMQYVSDPDNELLRASTRHQTCGNFQLQQHHG